MPAVSAEFQYPVSDQCQLSVPFLLVWLWPIASTVGTVLVPRLGPLPSKCSILVCVIVAQWWQFWQPDTDQCIWADSGASFIESILSLATGPSYFFRPSGSGPLSCWTVLSTWAIDLLQKYTHTFIRQCSADVTMKSKCDCLRHKDMRI